ncbi:hypothetical protein BJ508DRAFT_167685 [Ascobolus immersus RN42]|uniref:Uncharacterized protein n=1 Tax=Ascobolus immersus RN42 TaxID=1160509 RepID=A0A3N4IJH9_ASCIM|nr:hypothetical protein BJ508DRAFT_167685 [Ascobolus immersus RN42]
MRVETKRNRGERRQKVAGGRDGPGRSEGSRMGWRNITTWMESYVCMSRQLDRFAHWLLLIWAGFFDGRLVASSFWQTPAVELARKNPPPALLLPILISPMHLSSLLLYLRQRSPSAFAGSASFYHLLLTRPSFSRSIYPFSRKGSFLFHPPSLSTRSWRCLHPNLRCYKALKLPPFICYKALKLPPFINIRACKSQSVFVLVSTKALKYEQE